MKNCLFPISLKKPASEHSFDNFWSSRSFPNFRSHSCNKPSCANDVELGDMALAISVGITKDSQISPSVWFCSIWIQLFAQICDWSVDTELIDRKNNAKIQFNSFFTSVVVNGFLSTTFTFSILLFPKGCGMEHRMPAFSEIDHHDLCNSVPFTIWLVDVSSRPLFLTTKSQKWPTSLREIGGVCRKFQGLRHAVFFISRCSPDNVIVHWHEDDPSLKLLRFTL